MYVGVCRLTLATPAHSLKEKRSILRKLKDRAGARLRVHVAEVDLQDIWNRAVIGFSTVSGSPGVCDGVLDQVVRLVADSGLCEIVDDDRRVLQFDDIDFADDAVIQGKYG
jgi:hypothetical protein